MLAILCLHPGWCRLGMVPLTFCCCFPGRLWGLQDLLHEAEIPGRHVPGTKMPNCLKMTIHINVPAGSLYDIAANPPFWIAKHIFKVSMFHFFVRLLEGSWKMKHFDVGQVLHWWRLKSEYNKEFGIYCIQHSNIFFSVRSYLEHSCSLGRHFLLVCPKWQQVMKHMKISASLDKGTPNMERWWETQYYTQSSMIGWGWFLVFDGPIP